MDVILIARHHYVELKQLLCQHTIKIHDIVCSCTAVQSNGVSRVQQLRIQSARDRDIPSLKPVPKELSVANTKDLFYERYNST